MDSITTALKAFVIASGIVLVAGTVLLGVLLHQRARQPEPAAVGPAGGGTVLIPAGARVQQVVAADGRRLILLAADPAGRQYLAVVNALTGERLSLLSVEPEP